jgi:protein tyrosine/serine phosphatase
MNKNIFRFGKVYLALSLLISSLAHAEIKGYNHVTPYISRGALPTEVRDYELLASSGVKVVLSVLTTSSDIKKEKKIVERLGLQHVSIPLSGFFSPSNKDISKIMKLFANAKNKPVFVHCRYGEDRTGLVVGLYRVRQEGWTQEKAYQEMLDWGFTPALIGLTHYFWEHAEE